MSDLKSVTWPELTVSDPKWTLTIDIERGDGEDLKVVDARDAAESNLRKIGELDGWGGNWSFDGAQRLNYDQVRVFFTQ